MLVDNVVSKQKIVDGITYYFDTYKSKWLSVNKYNVSYGINHKNISCSRWLSVNNGVYSNNIGFRASRLSTIITLIPQSKNQSTCEFNVIRAGDVIVSAALDNESYRIFNSDVDFDEMESLGCFLEITNGYKIDFPCMILECAYRLT